MSMDDMEEKRAHDGTVEPVKSSDKCDKQVEINAALARLSRDWDDVTRDNDTQDAIIITGKDASEHLLSLGDDHDPALTFRSIVLATVLSCFSAVMAQIYYFKPTMVLISGTFIVLLAYFLGNAWATFLPRGDRHEVLWRSKGGTGKPPLWIRFLLFLNPSEWGLKEHAICSITATSASNTADIIQVFAAQDLFYDMPLNGTTVVLAVISIALFGYGISGLIRPLAVWDVEAVYWTSLPTVKTLQGLHWQKIRSSKPLRFFWYAFGSMFAYEFFPAYIFPWLNAVSIPCLAAMNATGPKAAVLTNLFGGSVPNEGLGWFALCFDWQYITSVSATLPLKLQYHQTAGLFVCFLAMLGIYYSNTWDAKSFPFMSTSLQSANGSAYPSASIFPGGNLNHTTLAEFGVPRMSGTFAYGILMSNAAIGALVAHTFLFWGKDLINAFKKTKEDSYIDRHHAHMLRHYKEVPQWWHLILLVLSFVLGLVLVISQNLTLPVWAYIVGLLLGMIIAPMSGILFSRYGGAISTIALSKMVAGLLIPERPVGNMYFAAWSHSVISTAVTLCNDLKMGEYLKVPPRVMFLTQVYGSILGGFVNYAVMISIVSGNRKLLVSGSGDSSWSGVQIQAFNTNATSWALSKYLYKAGATYQMVPIGLAIGAGLVLLHRILVHFVPKIGSFSLLELNMPQFIQYAGYIPYNQSQTCVLFSWTIVGFFCQYYLRNYRPRMFKDYMYLVTGAWDGASLTVLFILSFAVFGAGGPSIPFPTWWGNNADSGYYDHCPVSE